MMSIIEMIYLIIVGAISFDLQNIPKWIKKVKLFGIICQKAIHQPDLLCIIGDPCRGCC